jgi:hypothetical protein
MTKKTNLSLREPSSFRDPAGFLFRENDIIYRQVNPVGLPDYHYLMRSGLYQQLVEVGWLVPHEEMTHLDQDSPGPLIIRPARIPFISYPYEWCFSELQEAARLTLSIEKKALRKGMTLKDCSAFNVQFLDGKPIFIDTLSFERYQTGKPWDAYRQFCQHFVAPLALMAYVDVRLSQLFRQYIDGIPLDLASRLLPKTTYLNFGLLIHIHLHARSQKRFSDTPPMEEMGGEISLQQRLGLIESLDSAVRKLKITIPSGGWRDYETFHNYTPEAVEAKQTAVKEFLERINPKIVWDIGANTGVYSRLSCQMGASTIAFDLDPHAVEWNYRLMREEDVRNLLPLVLDITNPSPDLGWANEERKSLSARGPADAVLALALIHHLAIGNNLPFSAIAEFFQKITRALIIEFVPKNDPQVSRLLHVRKDIFTNYNQERFEQEFSRFFDLIDCRDITDSCRKIYLFKAKIASMN